MDVALCGAGPDHCCYVAGPACRYLRDDGPGASRRWVCTLRERLGSWTAVHADPGYREHVGSVLASLGQADCGDWPGPGVTCAVCGASG